ncbi:MAG: heavy-metal-associated domain-containing protein [Candidatus Omnitrophica bacterium]|nr:heavy-metal-associated domain-containing protein [Candidatus Omnitrophota bacterium]
MKQLAVWVVLGFFLFTGSPLSAVEPPAQVTTLRIPGMTTPEDAVAMEETLKELPGVSAVKASTEIESVVIVYDPAQTSAEQFIETVTESGYLATFAAANFKCPHCGATYSDDGQCIVCEVPLEPVATG